jgi:hypothetical protein
MILKLLSSVMFCAAAPVAILAEAPVPKAVNSGVVDSGTISSEGASYDGNALILKGQVLLDHGLGKMQAEEAILQKQEVGKDFPFSLIHLEKEVVLKLSQNGELKCEKADLDFGSLKGMLTSSRRVTYTDVLKRKKREISRFSTDGLFYRSPILEKIGST